MNKNSFEQLKNNPRLVGLIAASVASATVLASCSSVFSVQAGEAGVIKTGGNISSVVGPGFHLRVPLIQTVERFDTKQRVMELPDISVYYSAPTETKSANADGATDSLHANLAEGSQETHHKIAIIYQISRDNVQMVRENIGLETQVTERVTNVLVSTFKSVASSYNPLLLASARPAIEARTKENLVKAFDGTGITVVDFRHANFEFNGTVKQAYEEAVRRQAEVKMADAQRQKADIEAKTARITATGQADAAREQARGEADAIALKGAAEAESMEKRGAALRNNPDLIQLEAAQRWNGVLPSTMIPGTAVPMLQLPKAAQPAPAIAPETSKKTSFLHPAAGVYKAMLQTRQRTA